MKICLQKIYNSTVLLQRVKEKERGTKTNGEERVEVRKKENERKNVHVLGSYYFTIIIKDREIGREMFL